MISALVYLQAHSFRNRLVARIKRLKQPKYLAAAIVGGLYFYFYFFHYRFFSGVQRGRGLDVFVLTPEQRLLAELLGALALFVTVLLAWVIPHQRAALAFTEAEVAFLFPAPLSRRGLIHFKLVRSQMRILVTILVLTLILNWGGREWWIRAAGWWLILSTLHLHFLGSSFARTLLLDRGISNWLRRILVLAAALAAAGVVAFWARSSLPEFQWTDLSAEALADYARRVLTSGPALYLLYPFRCVTRGYLAPDATAFLWALPPALLIVLLHYVWVVYSNVAFEEASVAASQKMAERIAAARAGNVHGTKKRQRGKRPLFRLAPTGPPAVALLWKNLISAGQAFTWRIWIIIILPCVFAYIGLGNSLHGTEIYAALSGVLGILLGWSVLLGPQLVRQDLRQDLALVDVLKLYPLKGWQVVLGEVLAPAVILSVAQWLLVLFGAGFLLHARGFRDGLLPPAIALSAMMLLPLLNVLLLLIPNAAVILFPSWIQAGREGPRGIEATGQRLIFFLGQFMVITIALVPAALVFLPVFFVVHLAAGYTLAVLLASCSAGAVLAGESWLGLMLLGRWFERFDLSMELGQQ